MKKIIYAAMAFAPVMALAQSLGNVDTLVQNLRDLANSVIPLIFALALIYFFYGLAKYISNVSSDIKKADEGKTIMLWGIVALFVMVSVYGLLNWLGSATNLDNTGVTLPSVN